MIISGRKMDPEPIQDILASLEMTNETKKRLDNLQGWAKDLKVRVVPQSFFGIFIRVVYIFLKRRRRIFERETSRQRVFLSSVDLSLSLFRSLRPRSGGCRDYATIFFFWLITLAAFSFTLNAR